MLLHMIARVFKKIAVLDAAWTRDFAGAAAEAKVEMPNCFGIQGKPATLDGAHEVNAATRGIVFVSGFQISRAGRKAEAAMNAGHRFLFVEERRDHAGKADKTPRGSKVSLTRANRWRGKLAVCDVTGPSQ